MKIGYLWTHGNDEAGPEMRQCLVAAGCAMIFEDPESGSVWDPREQLEKAVAQVSTGDVLVVCDLGALGGLAELARVAARLVCVRASLQAIDDRIDTAVPGGAAFFRHVEVLSELRGRLHRKALKARYAAARRDGRMLGGKRHGRKRLLEAAQVNYARQEIEAGRASVGSMAKTLGVSEMTLRRALRRKD